MPVILRRLWIQLTADRRRFGALCATALLGLLLWARIIVTSNLPRTAVADESAAARDDRNSDGARPPAVSDNRRRAPVNVQLAEFPIRDPFLISDQYFPKPTSLDVLPQDQAKLQERPAEISRDPEALVATQLRGLVGRFTLEAVMQGRPMAIINGRTHQLGDWIPAVGNAAVRFRLVDVRYRSVVLECEGHRFELKMEPPGAHDRKP
ncbi:MAG: hypothetical protein V3T84_08905 [Phycisphaerales bacterium]